MRIRKQYQVIPTNAKLENGDSTSATNGYTADYINNHSVVVSAVEPSGSARKKVWLQHSGNIVNSENLQVINKGTYISSKNYATKGTILVKANTNYTFSLSKLSNDCRIYEYDESNTRINTLVPERLYYTFTTNSNTKSLAFYASMFADGSTTIENSKVMIVEGSTQTEYEPYAEDKEYILNNNVYEEFNENVYSTNEVRVGTWIDGKPLYRKVITGTRTTANGDIQLVGNVDNIIKINIIFKTENGQFMYFDSYRAGDNDFLQFYFRFSGTMLILGYRCGTSYPGANGDYNITLEYTKTTDD